ncbi:MAG: hypothetical protein HEQ35_08705 [Gloeotrichia echinulata IR180]|nr:hypothetical protein [Gloeotrichia echinulata DEX184]
MKTKDRGFCAGMLAQVKSTLREGFANKQQVPENQGFGRNSTVGHTGSGFCNGVKSLRTDPPLA